MTQPTDQTTQPPAPELECDVIMKGGITSGVIYPGALTEFAKTYRFRGLGGASAGAIGAAFGAAAELGRSSGGFERLAQVPEQLRDGALGRLFQPNSRTRVLFDVLTDVVAKDANGASLPSWRRGLRALGHLARGLWGASVTWAVVGVAWVAAGVAWGGTLTGLVIASGVILTVIGWVATAAALLLRRVTHDAVDNGFGICTGLQQDGNAGPGFTDWLSDTVDSLAALPPRTVPLTFGDLKHGRDPAQPDPEHRPITLLMMTTCLSRGRPYELPFRAPDPELYFDPVEWRRLFPEYVVEHLEQERAAPEWLTGKRKRETWEWESSVARRAVEMPEGDPAADVSGPPEDTSLRQIRSEDLAAEAATLRGETGHPALLRLPPDDDLPVVVAMRMSLSFPALISAVPLWVVRYSRRTRLAQRAYRSGDVALAEKIGFDYEKLWFSDGGLCSNFPIHLFDSPIPTRPTFGINLDRFQDDRQRNPDEGAEFADGTEAAGRDERPWTNYVYARTNSEELEPTYRPIGGTGLAAIKAFAVGALDTSRNWQDNAYLAAPGYRDRIIRVRQTRGEGGLNLDMPTDVIQRLVERGGYAAQALTRQFSTPVYERTVNGDVVGRFTGWENHRWLRYRALIGSMPGFLAGYRRGREQMAGVDPENPPSFDVTLGTLKVDAAIDEAMCGLAERIWTDDDAAKSIRRNIAARPRGAGTLRRTVQL